MDVDGKEKKNKRHATDVQSGEIPTDANNVSMSTIVVTFPNPSIASGGWRMIWDSKKVQRCETQTAVGMSLNNY